MTNDAGPGEIRGSRASALLKCLHPFRFLLVRVQEDTEGEHAVYPFLLSLASAAFHSGEEIGLRAADVALPEEVLGGLLVRGKKGAGPGTART
ncbi:hypothetical protein AA958_24580 [Streptomyces sp. CNQ-509]|uniref:hypothetical protein n=1 Tax=Streptomyces sp. CNQ-509 TaxID=444103 RepID=UPI00062DCFA2|nr:hypothetical protein [Streptomyces sp. CNQ-509]AKH84856.1 hypothetical protein AA958_24580 [Streptomyces sp. CNQ-509]